MNYMTVKEFRELGFLQEVNRLLLHRAGLALEVIINDDGSEQFGGIWDCRDQPNGISYCPGVISKCKVKTVAALMKREPQGVDETIR
jgi:hypothetical protein